MTKNCCTPQKIQQHCSSLNSTQTLSHSKLENFKESPFVSRGWCHIPSGDFMMGNDDVDAIPGDDEGPTHNVTLDAYRIAATTVTNLEFSEFIRATQYVTEAEKFGSSFVFYLQVSIEERNKQRQFISELPWWLSVPFASWQRPEGSGSHIHDRPNHPVVHISWHDAMAYCQWSGTTLPTEEQWERAARGGLIQQRFAWGNELKDMNGLLLCNIFRGVFPHSPEQDWQPAPIEADKGEPNRFGLFNVCGNVWEWCTGSLLGDNQPLRGGSYLCHDSYCYRYRVAARNSNTASTSASNIGFRVISLT
jgi:sulfatase modifying factor 1